MTQDRRCSIGIDVGTGSARAGVFDAGGKMLGQGSHPIKMWKPQADFVEQSSDDIWGACAAAVRQAVGEAGIEPTDVRGIGFDATCSLVALDENDRPVSVSPTGNDEQNVVVWMDHRALEQADRINQGGHAVLRYVGGIISPEMESPKLSWLKENLPDCWKRTRRFFDLPDFLTYRATGDETRSLCTTVCKWTYQGHLEPTIPGSVGSWDDTYWRSIGLGELASEGYRRIGTRIRPMGEPIARGLTAGAAADFGLPRGTPVAVSIIDAHAGGVGVLGARLSEGGGVDLEKRLALIGGTSSCHMAVSKEPRFVNGVWGPFYSAMIPGLWLTEGGQSATGALIDHIIFSHVRGRELELDAKQRGITVYEILAEVLDRLAEGTEFPAGLTRDLHVQPDFHGNRSPRSNPHARGMISGLKLGESIEDLALLYLATIQAVAHGTRHILDVMTRSGYEIQTVLITGGGAKNPIFLREHADITGRRIVLPKEPEAVLLGSAMLGAVAAG
ncbi:MAG: FGGY-family carbohydrate kinase, partial [Pseudomonadota bacterium]